MIKYSFIMVCYNNFDLTVKAIESFAKSFDSKLLKEIELIIVDNASEEVEYAQNKLFVPLIQQGIIYQYKRNKKNIGYPFGVNTGLALAKGEIFTVLNNDLLFPEGWFDGILSTFNTHEEVGAVVPYLSYASGLQHVGFFSDIEGEIQSFFNEFTVENKAVIQYSNRVIGACVSIRECVINQVGGYNFWYGLGMYDDDEWCLRILTTGYKIAVTGSSFVYHKGNATISKYSDKTTAAIISNGPKFLKSWDLMGPEYPEGSFSSRDKAVSHQPYSKEQHFFPYKLSQYTDTQTEVFRKIMPSNAILIADWTNELSEWKISLNNLLEEGNLRYIELYVPKDYFDMRYVLKDVDNILSDRDSSSILVGIYDAPLSPSVLRTYLNNFERVATVDNDFVNDYICYVNDSLF